MENSPLSRLPAEIRNRISALAVTNDETFKILPMKKSPPLDADAVKMAEEIRLVDLPKHAGALRHTCRALRYETTAMFYAFNTFAVHPRDKPRSVRSIRDFQRGIEAVYAIVNRLEMTGVLQPIVVDLGAWFPKNVNYVARHVGNVLHDLFDVAQAVPFTYRLHYSFTGPVKLDDGQGWRDLEIKFDVLVGWPRDALSDMLGQIRARLNRYQSPTTTIKDVWDEMFRGLQAEFILARPGHRDMWMLDMHKAPVLVGSADGDQK